MVVKKFRIPFTKILFRFNRTNLFLFWGEKMKASLSCDPITDEERYWGEYIGINPPDRIFWMAVEICTKGQTMTITTEQRESLELAAKPLMDWLAKNCHPHTMVIVEGDRAELLEGLAMVRSGIQPTPIPESHNRETP